MEILSVQITAEDIEGSRRYGVENPIIFALSRATGTLWRMADHGVVLEVTPPHRTFLLRKETLERWRAHVETCSAQPFDLEVECHSFEAVAGQYAQQEQAAQGHALQYTA